VPGNRLAAETSPYLRQHSSNPVDWYPWGPEAFERARELQRPVMLSVGYSTCHWCHVMAHESFEDDRIAALLNERFVSVKVDREERPDVDAVYMDAVQAMSGRGGWPMTVFLTPDGRPFFAGTYFPRHRRGGMPGFEEVLEAVDDAWRSRRGELHEQADRVLEAIRPSGSDGAGGGALRRDACEAAAAALKASADRRWGGFGGAPKFPQAPAVDLLLREWAKRRDTDSLEVAGTSLAGMAAGGIYDHLGGGFARYSVDERWLVPHFEKMLYDQALLCRAYLHAWQLTGEPQWRQVVEETVTYVLRDLRDPEGGIRSAEDADSEGGEGRFYLWTTAEIRSVLGPSGSAEAIAWYGATDEGNFEGSNILHRPALATVVRSPEIERARRALFEARATRARPAMDDKVLTEWNAMFCSVLAEAAAAMRREDWARAAAEVAEFLLAQLRRADGRWLRSWQAGRARHLAYAADYAWLVDAFVRLRELTGRNSWIRHAAETADAMLGLFLDSQDGGLFTTGHDAERLVVRSKELVDGSTPAASSVAALALARLAALTGDRSRAEQAERVLGALEPALARYPSAVPYAVAASELLAGGSTEVVVAGERPDLVAVVQERFIPDGVLAWGERFESPLWAGRQPGLAYVCRDYSCRAPASAPDELAQQLDALW
jgi:uncharacterized protein YyaL (SSP411 family)